jgi:cyclopropane fatty-acyl-phospholipid synthase-like methyltransferase
MKPYAESCDQNREPILAVLRERLGDCLSVLEIGSGTGQHAVYFATALPHLVWQTSELTEHHAGIQAWLDEADLANVRPPITLDVSDPDAWPRDAFDAVFTANTLHIMGETEVAELFTGVGRVLDSGGLFLAYGPFNYGGRYSSDSNARFDQWLKARDPRSGIKDLDWLRELADQAGLVLDEDIEMPVNNRILVWHRL